MFTFDDNSILSIVLSKAKILSAILLCLGANSLYISFLASATEYFSSYNSEFETFSTNKQMLRVVIVCFFCLAFCPSKNFFGPNIEEYHICVKYSFSNRSIS